MKTMTLTQIGLLTLVLTFSATALAERGAQSHERPETMRDLVEALDLTTEQRQTLREFKRERRELHANRKGDCDMKGVNKVERQEMRQEMRQQRQARQS